MIPEHMHKLRDLAQQYEVPIYQLMDTYCKKQTQYLHRDLNNNKPVTDILKCSGYGNKALEVMEMYLKKNR